MFFYYFRSNGVVLARTVARKFSIGGLYICSGGLDILRKLHRFMILHNSTWGTWSFAWSGSAPKRPRGDGAGFVYYFTIDY